jgi:PAS domain S-box-containing protein
LARRSLESRLDDSHLKLRLAIRAAQIGIWEWDLESGTMNYSPRARAICGFLPDEPVTIEKVRQVTHPDDFPHTSELARRALDPELREKPVYEYRIVTADKGDVRWVLAYGEAIFVTQDGATKASRYIGTIADITDRKETELALRESELRQRLALEGARMAIWEVDLVTDKLTGSQDLNRIFGFPPDATPTIEELRGCYGPGERERVRRVAEEALAKGEHKFEVEFRCHRLDGELRWLMLRAEVMFGSSGEMQRVVGVLMDIDARKKSEERQFLLVRELNHRVKNSLSVVQAIANQTFRNKSEPEAVETFQSRLRALSKANAVLLESEFEAFDLLELIDGIIAPYWDPKSRISLEGGRVTLPPRLNVPLALALHELSTNAAKYGALSVPEGHVQIVWRHRDRMVDLWWSEHGGPPPDLSRKGFGTRLITETVAVEIGQVDLIAAETAISCHFSIAL